MPSEKYYGSTKTQMEKVIERHNFANQTYKDMCLNNEEVLNATLKQITFCIQFNKFLTETQIRDMLMCKSEFQVERKAHAYKYAANSWED